MTGPAVKNQVHMEPTRLSGERNAGRCGLGGHAFGDGFGGGFELRVDLGGVLLQVADGGDAGGHGERIAAEGSGLVDRAERREQVHEAALAAEDADGQAAADDLAQRDQVGVDAVKLAARRREPRGSRS